MSQIPQVIHYIWFGNNPKSPLILSCIESWKKYLPGWEIKEWNESNYDLNKSEYMTAAYAAQKYAYAADYARFDILHEFGGIYFDTDVELLQPIPTDILASQAFSGMESNNMVNPGLVLAASPGNEFLEEVLSFYDTLDFRSQIENNETVVTNTTKLLEKYGLKRVAEIQCIKDITIYPSQYFCSYNLDYHEMDITFESISVHHYAGSWMAKKELNKIKYKKFVKETIGAPLYKKLVAWKRRKNDRT